MDITYHPVGIVHSPLTEKVGAPIQGRLAPETRGQLEVFPEFEEGLLDVEGFSHLIILYHFHLSRDFRLKTRPFLEDVEHGVFSMRAPQRPNPIGLSVVRLEKREGRFLWVAELDVLDETPLLDIKPYVPAFDHRPDAVCGWMDKHIHDGLQRPRADDRFD